MRGKRYPLRRAAGCLVFLLLEMMLIEYGGIDMKILVLNGSPRPNGNTAALIGAFVEGAKANGHDITVVPVCQKKIAG